MGNKPSPFSITGDLTPPFDTAESTALYRVFDSERLLYIGVTDNPLRRWSRHAATKTWWPQVRRCDLTWYMSRVEALGAERSAIRDEHPRYNDVHSAPVSAQKAERLLTEWAANAARRDPLVRAANAAGVSKNRIHTLTGIARTTIDRITERPMSKQDLAYQVSLTLGDHIQDFDINAIVEEITTEYGSVPNIDAVPSEEYWAIVEKYDLGAVTTYVRERSEDDENAQWENDVITMTQRGGEITETWHVDGVDGKDTSSFSGDSEAAEHIRSRGIDLEADGYTRQ